MLLHRYGNIDYVLHLPLKRAMKIIVKAQEEESRDYCYRLWLVRYPLYTEQNYETFAEFYEKVKPTNKVSDARNKKDIMADIKNIENQFRKEGANGTI